MKENVLRKQRENLNLKQAEVAEYVGVTPQTYMKWENGKNEPKASDIGKLAQVLKISANEIVSGKILEKNIDPILFMKEIARLESLLDVVTKTDILIKHVENVDELIKDLKQEVRKRSGIPEAVSYTHLTLPTIYSV